MHAYMHVLLCMCGSQDDLRDSVLPTCDSVYLAAAAKDSKSISGPRKTRAHSAPWVTIQRPRGLDLDRKGNPIDLPLTPATCYLNLIPTSDDALPLAPLKAF